MIDKFPTIWGIGLAAAGFYAFFGRQTVGALIPALGTERGWLLSFIGIGVLLIVMLLFFNIIEAVADAEQADPGH